MGELLFNGGLLIFFIAMFIYSGQIQIWEGYFGARYWPMMLIGFAILIFAVKTYTIFKKLPGEERKFSLKIFHLKETGVKKLLASFAWVCFYAWLLPYGGYVLSTILFAMGLSWLLGMRSLPKMFLAALAVTAIIYAVFVWGLDVMPPRGIGPIYEFSSWLEYLI
ncbi:MAG: tripartite tricarboxylate transporter TctB family protein [Enterocloster asparagiformis]|nr:tripartite tricarboxylate transporter TctB family protein [Enterocloster asparagiformis]